MSIQHNQITLARQRLHWGILVMPLLVAVPLRLMILPVAFFFQLPEPDDDSRYMPKA